MSVNYELIIYKYDVDINYCQNEDDDYKMVFVYKINKEGEKMIYDSEKEILEDCFAEKSSDVLIFSDNENDDLTLYNESIRIYQKIISSKQWFDNSKNTNNPPDMINEELRVFLEVMRFDDHSNNGKKNATRARASKMQEELYDKMPEAKGKKIILNAVTDLPTDEDHSYKKYLNGFKRTVEKHLNKIPKYVSNYPDYKKGFLVFDESSGIYYELKNKTRKEVLEYRTITEGRPHFFFLDKAFVNVFLNSELDYLIWYAPYKIDTNHLDLKMPKVVFYDLKRFKCNKMLKDFDEPRMISCEI